MVWTGLKIPLCACKIHLTVQWFEVQKSNGKYERMNDNVSGV